MVELEESLLLILSSYMTSWKCSVDKAIVYVKTDAMKHALFILSSHGSILCTYEQ